jgi:hypothetical protein
MNDGTRQSVEALKPGTGSADSDNPDDQFAVRRNLELFHKIYVVETLSEGEAALAKGLEA